MCFSFSLLYIMILKSFQSSPIYVSQAPFIFLIKAKLLSFHNCKLNKVDTPQCVLRARSK